MLELVKQWFSEAADSDELYESDLEYSSVGTEIDFDSIPVGYTLKVIHTETDRGYNSYGDQSLEDGFIVFSVTNPEGVSENFKLPVEYSSYEGWNMDYFNITKTEKRSRVVTTWEWE